MRVAVVSPYDLSAPGGVQDQVIGLVTRLRERGHDAWAVAPGGGGPAGTRQAGSVRGVPANRSRAPIGIGIGTPALVRAGIAGADVVHVHEPLMPMVSLSAVRSADPPVVGTFHADPGAAARGVYRVARPLLRRLAKRLAVATAVSETARAAVAGFVETRIIPNAVDVAAFGGVGVDRGRFGVVFLGRDEPRKGLDVLLDAWAAVREAHPAATLRVLGARRHVAPPGVEYLGRVSEEEKRRELAAAAVLAAPNLGGESFGIILVEGMAAGCAVVASDLAAFAAVVGDGGILVPRGDAAALGAALTDLLDDPVRCSAVATAGERVADRFDWGKVIEAYLGAYREALAAGS